SWGHAQLNADGTFSIGGLLPGTYTLNARANGAAKFPYTTKQPAARVTAIVNDTITRDVYMADAVTVKPSINVGLLPPLSIVNCPDSGGDCPPETWKTYALPQGTPFSPQTVTNLLVGGGGGENTPGLFVFSPSTGMLQGSGCYGQFQANPGFCTSALAASKNGSAYDFHLMRTGEFDSANRAGGARPYFVLETSTRGIIVGPDYANGLAVSFSGSQASTTTLQVVSVKPAVSLAGLQQATLSGTVTAASMINLRQFQSLAGNFEEFTKYLPVVWVYDSEGTLKAAGIVVPYPPNLSKDSALDNQLNQAVASGNFAQFLALTGPVSGGGWGPLGYEIRGLTAGTVYNLVVTTPNYPPYKTSVTLGALNSTTTVNVNLDSNTGAAISGIVQSTVSVKLSGAQVTVKASGYGPATLTTNSSGYWNLSGLGAGQYQVTAVAAGYAQGVQSVDVTGTGAISVPTFSLGAANATISGTVYTNNPVCPPDVTCSAFGKTALPGIPVLAYDDTLNLSDPTGELPLYRAVTDSSGTYTLTGLSATLLPPSTTSYHHFKIFVNAPGYFVLNQSTEAVVGDVVGFDFALKPKPLDIGVFGRPNGDVYEFQITNYKDFSGGNAWVGASPFVLAASTPLSPNDFFEEPDADGATQLFLSYSTATLTAGTQYTLHLEAQPNDPRAPLVVKEVPFGLNLPHAVCQSVDQALIGDDEGV
ncbi:MAG: carboxypeptidase-like regulatory domain-containing protein, partial [Elusimicrobiota bacterium]